MSEKVDKQIEEFKAKLVDVGNSFRRVVEENASLEIKIKDLRDDLAEANERLVLAADMTLINCARCDRPFLTSPEQKFCTDECRDGFTKIPHQEKACAATGNTLVS